MYSPTLSQKLCLVLSGLGLTGLLLAACATGPHSFHSFRSDPLEIVWTYPVEIYPRTGATIEKAFQSALEQNSSVYEMSSHYTWYKQQKCDRYDSKAKNHILVCDGNTPGPQPFAVHVAQHVSFADQDHKKAFLTALGLPRNSK